MRPFTGCYYLISMSVCPSVLRLVSVCNVRSFYWLRELYEADFHKPEIYGIGREWDNAWDVFPRMPSRVGRGRRVAVYFVVCLGWGGKIFSIFFFRILFFSSNAHGLLQVWGRLASFTSLLVMRPFFAFGQKSLFIPGCVQGAII